MYAETTKEFFEDRNIMKMLNISSGSGATAGYT